MVNGWDLITEIIKEECRRDLEMESRRWLWEEFVIW